LFSLQRIRESYKTKTLPHFLRFFLQMEREKRLNLNNQIRSWYNRQILKSYCTTVGSNLIVGARRMTLKIRGNVTMGIGTNVDIKTPIHISLTSYFSPEAKLEIGDGTHIGNYSSIRVAKSITIGKNCLIARWVRIFDHSGHPLDPDMRLARKKIPENEIRPVIIGNNVWIGEDSFINAGVTIGSGSIVSANSVVTKNVPENVIVFGSPARPIYWFKKEDKKVKALESKA